MGKPRFVQVRHPGCPGCSTDTAPSQNHSSCPKSCPVPWSSPYQCSMQEFCPHPPHSVPGGVRVQKQQFKNSFPGSARGRSCWTQLLSLGNHRGTFWLWWNPVNEGRCKNEPLENEFLLGGSESWGDWKQCQVQLGQSGSIQKPEHPSTPTSG